MHVYTISRYTILTQGRNLVLKGSLQSKCRFIDRFWTVLIYMSHISRFWTVLIYMSHISRFGSTSLCHIFYRNFFNHVSFSCCAPPLKNLPSSDSLDDIISESSVSRTKDTDICSPTKWILDYNGSACFPTIGYHSLSFLDIPCAFLT